MTLPGDQYSEDSIRLLAASSREYSRAKCVKRLRVVVSILIALCAPIATYLVPAVTNYLAIAGGVWLLLSTVVLKRLQSALTKRAATIQEEFDTKLFDLPWNKMLIGDHESRELIRHADAKFKTDRKVLHDWYPESGQIGPLVSILLCQRANLVWDWRLKKSYGCLVGIMTAVLFAGGVMAAVATDQKLVDYILRFLNPSLSVLALGLETAWAHFEISNNKQTKEKLINGIWERVKKDPGSLTLEECRQLQDCIFLLRSLDPLVPNWWYRIRRRGYDGDMREAIEDFKGDVTSGSRNGKDL